MSSLVPRRRPGTGLSEGGLLPAVFPKHRDAEDRLFDTFDTLNSVFNSKGFQFLELETFSPPDWGASPSRELRIYFIGRIPCHFMRCVFWVVIVRNWDVWLHIFTFIYTANCSHINNLCVVRARYHVTGLLTLKKLPLRAKRGRGFAA